MQPDSVLEIGMNLMTDEATKEMMPTEPSPDSVDTTVENLVMLPLLGFGVCVLLGAAIFFSLVFQEEIQLLKGTILNPGKTEQRDLK